MSDELHDLVRALQQPALFPHPVTRFAVIETHISIILLTGDYAYKFKKPVNFGFLDFSTLERRRHCCAEELRLNRRLAPELYLDLMPVCSGPRLCDDGEIIEYAVRMREFDQDAQFDRLLTAGQLTPELIDALAVRVADFHATVAVAGPDTVYGLPATAHAPVEENFTQIREQLADADARQRLAPLQDWSQRTFASLHDGLQARKDGGFIRECHGDLHLRNIALVDGRPLAFDCIEFNDRLRWIDIISEVAFMVMDLVHRGQSGLTSRFLNAWLVRSGDYAGITYLRYYLVYRAMVRAKVDCLRAHQPDVDVATRDGILRDYPAYIDLAARYTRATQPLLVLMHGLSGSGKTTVSGYLLEQLPAIRLRSDIERKRLHGLPAHARSWAGIDAGIYDRAAGERTYTRLLELAGTVLAAGYAVIVDAAFLQSEQRAPFIALAEARGIRCVIVNCRADEAELRARVSRREQAMSDASEAGVAVLERQLAQYRVPIAEEGAAVIETGSDSGDMPGLLARLRGL
jgi:aminoglycoside phosphotransferase family enzyme/predicted kinase